MPGSDRKTTNTAILSMCVCAAMMAHQVGGKALRDTLFFRNFSFEYYAVMVGGASFFCILMALVASQVMSRVRPSRLVPAAFLVTATTQLFIWANIDTYPRACAIIEYLLIVGPASVLTSAFWSVINESFDPRTAKQFVGRIAGAGTLGGIIGGLVARSVRIDQLLPVLAGYHFTCAALVFWISFREEPTPVRPDDGKPGKSAFQIVQEAPYLLIVAAVVLLGTVSAAMIDFAFKYRVTETYGSGTEEFKSFIATFYSVVGALSFLVQIGLSSTILARFGMANTVGTLPMAVTLGGLIALVPGIFTATLARGIEAVFRGSLFRAGYELFYTPMPKMEKRIAKPVVDVGFDRLGDAVGAGTAGLLFGLGATYGVPSILAVAVLVALCALYAAKRLHGAYVDALERGLREQGEALQIDEHTESTFAAGASGMFTLSESHSLILSRSALGSSTPASRPGLDLAMHSDPVLQMLGDLRSGDEQRVLHILQSPEPLPSFLVPSVIHLLAWDKVSNEAVEALRRSLNKHTGQLIDALLDKDTDFTVRRRLPRILSASDSDLALQGLLTGLNDKRFEVRFQCGRAVSRIKQRSTAVNIPEAGIFAAIRREVAVNRSVWESQRVLDRGDEHEESPFVDEVLRSRATKSLQHVFTLLSIVLAAEPLRIAFHGLTSADTYLRGTALEYLDSVLPRDIRDRLWPLLDHTSQVSVDVRPREEVLAELMSSSQSMVINLEDLRRQASLGDKPGTKSG